MYLAGFGVAPVVLCFAVVLMSDIPYLFSFQVIQKTTFRTPFVKPAVPNKYPFVDVNFQSIDFHNFKHIISIV